MKLTRVAAAGSVALTGVGLLVPNAVQLLGANDSLASLLLAALGSLVALALVAAGALLYRSDIADGHIARVAGWNLLGLVVLGLVLLLISLYPPVELPAFIAGDVLGVSAVAHVLIGVNDVRRIRARELAVERERLAVLNRLLRHNLSHDAQVLIGYSEQLESSLDDPELAGLAATVKGRAEGLGERSDKIDRMQRLVSGDAHETSSVDLDALAADLAAEFGADNPDAELRVDVPESTAVLADDQLRAVLAELLANAVAHNDQQVPRVTLAADGADDDGWIDVSVSDNGPGIPEEERAVVAGEAEITQLTHGSGLGLWLTKWLVDSYGGTLGFGEDEAGGNVVTLRLRRGETAAGAANPA